MYGDRLYSLSVIFATTGRRNARRVSMGALFGFVPCLTAHCTRSLGHKQHYCRQGYFSLPPLSVSVARARCWIRFISVISICEEISRHDKRMRYILIGSGCYLVGRLVTTVHLYLPGPILAHVGGIGTAHEGDDNLFFFFFYYFKKQVSLLFIIMRKALYTAMCT